MHASIRTSLPLAALALALAAGCGDATNGGGGSRTLLVNASVSASGVVDNAQTSGQFSTEFRVNVSKGGTPVNGATVKITSDAGATVLVAGNDPGSYVGQQTGYLRTYSLDVIAGADTIEGATVTGPEPHAFEAPLPGALVPMSQPLAVRWSPNGAPEATVETNKMDPVATPDNGTFTVAVGILESEVGKIKEDRVRVRRTNRVALDGGVAGSSLSVSVRNQVQIQVDGR